jgi:hypothetical protein
MATPNRASEPQAECSANSAVGSGELLTTRQVAWLLSLAPGTLASWRCRRRPGLPWVRLGRSVRYRRTDVQLLISTGLVQPKTGNTASPTEHLAEAC